MVLVEGESREQHIKVHSLLPHEHSTAQAHPE
jgi:hypothetical protein